MKAKFLLVLALCGFVTTAQAQLKVHSNGNTSLLSTTQALSPLSINFNGNSQYAVAYKGDYNGIYCENTGHSATRDYAGNFIVRCRNNKYSFGLHSDVMADSAGITGKGAYALVGRAGNGLKGFGVLGCATNCTKGAGVFGADYLTYGYIPDNHIYAGYFAGDVRVTDNLTVAGSIQGTLLGPSASSLPAGAVIRQTTRQIPAYTFLSMLNASEYSYTVDSSNDLLSDYSMQWDSSEAKGSTNGDELFGDEKAKPVNIVEQQRLKKSHFALDAEQLQDVLPDLVYETEDGTKVINYMEIIPLLVQSVKELSAKLAALEDGSDARTSRGTVSSVLRPAIAGTSTQATLYQNQPNPFTSQTVIRFSLPEKAPASYIYIFDMQGKMVRQLPVNASMQSVTINGYELQAGIYLYSLVVGGQEVDTKRMILSK